MAYSIVLISRNDGHQQFTWWFASKFTFWDVRTVASGRRVTQTYNSQCRSHDYLTMCANSSRRSVGGFFEFKNRAR